MKKGFTFFLSILLLVCAAAFSWYAYSASLTQVHQMQFLGLAGILSASALVLAVILLYERKKGRVSGGYLAVSLILIAGMTAGSLNFAGAYSLPDQETVPNFYGQSLVDAQAWASAHGVELSTSFEYSDEIDQYSVISQNVAPGTLAKDTTSLSVSVSDGPNYDKSLIVPNMLGWTLDDVVDFIDKNFMNNVSINFQDSSVDEYTVITQSEYGEMRRNTAVSFVISHHLSSMKDQAMASLAGKSEFEATLWLKKYAIPYEITREFSETVERGHVISTDPSRGETVGTSSKVSLVISRGREIEVPDLLSMSVEEITSWIVQNGLSVKFSESYDEAVPAGSVLSASQKEGDIIEQGTTISLVLSKGALTMPAVTSLSEFRVWASSYGVDYTVSYEYSDTVSAGGIISTSLSAGSVIPNGASITVRVSKGAPATVPNVVGMTYDQAVSALSNAGLYCSSVYGGYNSAAKGTVLRQNLAAGTQVDAGTTVTVTLSSGPAKTYSFPVIQEGDLGDSYAATVSSLRSLLAEKCPGVNFTFHGVPSNSLGSGNWSDNGKNPAFGSPVTQGQTYDIYIVDNS